MPVPFDIGTCTVTISAARNVTGHIHSAAPSCTTTVSGKMKDSTVLGGCGAHYAGKQLRFRRRC